MLVILFLKDHEHRCRVVCSVKESVQHAMHNITQQETVSTKTRYKYVTILTIRKHLNHITNRTDPKRGTHPSQIIGTEFGSRANYMAVPPVLLLGLICRQYCIGYGFGQ